MIIGSPVCTASSEAAGNRSPRLQSNYFGGGVTPFGPPSSFGGGFGPGGPLSVPGTDSSFGGGLGPGGFVTGSSGDPIRISPSDPAVAGVIDAETPKTQAVNTATFNPFLNIWNSLSFCCDLS